MAAIIPLLISSLLLDLAIYHFQESIASHSHPCTSQNTFCWALFLLSVVLEGRKNKTKPKPNGLLNVWPGQRFTGEHLCKMKLKTQKLRSPVWKNAGGKQSPFVSVDYPGVKLWISTERWERGGPALAVREVGTAPEEPVKFPQLPPPKSPALGYRWLESSACLLTHAHIQIKVLLIPI